MTVHLSTRLDAFHTSRLRKIIRIRYTLPIWTADEQLAAKGSPQSSVSGA